jgi:hypothetical protein
MNRIAQPPIAPTARAAERHDFWPGFIAAVIGAVLLFCGVRHLTGIETVEGGTAWETQLVKAYSSGGLKYPQHAALTPPPKLDDPVAAAAALDRWQRQNAHPAAPAWKVRVDTAAKTPCPT